MGRASFSRLRRLGISTIGELAHTDRELLRTHFKSYGEVIWTYANGRDCAQVESVVPPNKGYGNSTTIAFDICDTVSAGLVLLSLAETIGIDVYKRQLPTWYSRPCLAGRGSARFLSGHALARITTQRY